MPCPSSQRGHCRPRCVGLLLVLVAVSCFASCTYAKSNLVLDSISSAVAASASGLRRLLPEKYGPRMMEYTDDETRKLLDGAAGPGNVFLIWTTDASTFDELATQCIDSVMKTYGSRVRLFANQLKPEDLRARGWQAATMIRFKPEQVLMDTPLFRYYMKHQEHIRSGPYFFSHLSDFMRLALMYKHGGLYFDADVLVLRPVSDAYRNRLIVHPWDMGRPDNHSSIESAVMFHDAGDPYLFEVMRYITLHYSPEWWVAAAAWPLMEIYLKAPLNSLRQKPGLVPTSVYFGLQYWPAYEFWDKNAPIKEEDFKGCEVVHLWGSVARGYHHKRNESDYMRSPENIKRVRDRLDVLRSIKGCQPDAPRITDWTEDKWMLGPIRNTNVDTKSDETEKKQQRRHVRRRVQQRRGSR